jgi:hypothetical protein
VTFLAEYWITAALVLAAIVIFVAVMIRWDK